MNLTRIVPLILILMVFSCKKHKEESVLKTVESDAILVETNIHINEELKIDVSKEFLLGKFNYKTDSSFVKVPANYSSKTLFVKKVVCDSFVKMAEMAKKDSIHLTILSGTRNFNEQKIIWERKWKKLNGLNDTLKAKKILEFSSMPSTSRHHWGTDIDINNLNNAYFNSGKGFKEYQWLKNNAKKFGFFQPYKTKEFGRSGYNMEKWHWSFRPLSELYLSAYNEQVEYSDISDFLGHETSQKLLIIKNYVNGIDKR